MIGIWYACTALRYKPAYSDVVECGLSLRRPGFDPQSRHWWLDFFSPVHIYNEFKIRSWYLWGHSTGILVLTNEIATEVNVRQGDIVTELLRRENNLYDRTEWSVSTLVTYIIYGPETFYKRITDICCSDIACRYTKIKQLCTTYHPFSYLHFHSDKPLNKLHRTILKINGERQLFE